MKYFGGCDVGSTYTKAIIIDETGKIMADTTIRSKMNAQDSAEAAMQEVLGKVGLKSSKELQYLIGTGYGRNKVPFADENISEISCHAMGVHVTNPDVKAIIDIGGQDVKGISIDSDGTVKNFAMNDKCAAGTGRFFEAALCLAFHSFYCRSWRLYSSLFYDSGNDFFCSSTKAIRSPPGVGNQNKS